MRGRGRRRRKERKREWEREREEKKGRQRVKKRKTEREKIWEREMPWHVQKPRVFWRDLRGQYCRWWNITLAENVFVGAIIFALTSWLRGKDNLSIYWYPSLRVVLRVLICFCRALALPCMFGLCLVFHFSGEDTPSPPVSSSAFIFFNSQVSQIGLQYPSWNMVSILETLYGSHIALPQNQVHRNEQKQKINCLHVPQDMMTVVQNENNCLLLKYKLSGFPVYFKMQVLIIKKASSFTYRNGFWKSFFSSMKEF